MARGQPKRPAPVAGPGAMARRTDGGPGSKTQPIRTPTGLTYGEGAALEAQQKAAPLPAPNTGLPAGSPPSGGGAPAPGGAMPTIGNIFAPTEQPNVPLNTGLAPSGQPLPLDGDTLLRILIEKRPSPYLARLLQNDNPRRF